MIPTALLDLLKSEKAFAGGVLVIAATIFVLLNRMTIPQWQDFVTWVFGIYAAGHTVSGVARTIKGDPTPTPSTPVPPPTDAKE